MGTSTARGACLVKAARELFEEQGYENTSVADITERAGCSRPLFYHYYRDLDDIMEATLDSYVDGFVAAVKEWNDGRTQGDVEGALHSAVRLLRRCIANSPFSTSPITECNAKLYLRFIHRAADELSSYIVDSTVRDYEQLHTVEISHVKETFYVLIAGITAFIRNHPAAPDNVVEALIAQTLRLDLGR